MATQEDHNDAGQSAVVEFLRNPSAYPHGCDKVEVAETHGALVFLAGEHAYKMKKAVRFAYMDFSTLSKREHMCRREFELNAPHAPQVYLDIVPVAREPDGSLSIGGTGTVVEWLIHMRRFGEETVLAKMAARDAIDRSLAEDLAAEIVRYHAAAPVLTGANASARIAAVIEELADVFAEAPDLISDRERERFLDTAKTEHRRIAPVMNDRAANGFVRRGHGDLHLNNIIVLDGKPVLFDALEFDEDLATIDVFYDLAFLLMDLDRKGLRAIANIVLNRYLHLSANERNLDGLATLPLFLACRAGVRALVAIARRGQKTGSDVSDLEKKARNYFSASLAYLEVSTPMLVAVGGLSGTGKSTLGGALAPDVGRIPGALHFRSDLERKALHGVSDTTRLPRSAYTREQNDRVYTQLCRKAEHTLKAGHSVIVDAVFSKAGERLVIEEVARACGAQFVGLWLEAGEEELFARVRGRKGDASDATVDVVRGQLERGTGTVEWQTVDASGTREDTLAAAREIIAPLT